MRSIRDGDETRSARTQWLSSLPRQRTLTALAHPDCPQRLLRAAVGAGDAEYDCAVAANRKTRRRVVMAILRRYEDTYAEPFGDGPLAAVLRRPDTPTRHVVRLLTGPLAESPAAWEAAASNPAAVQALLEEYGTHPVPDVVLAAAATTRRVLAYTRLDHEDPRVRGVLAAVAAEGMMWRRFIASDSPDYRAALCVSYPSIVQRYMATLREHHETYRIRPHGAEGTPYPYLSEAHLVALLDAVGLRGPDGLDAAATETLLNADAALAQRAASALLEMDVALWDRIADKGDRFVAGMLGAQSDAQLEHLLGSGNVAAARDASGERARRDALWLNATPRRNARQRYLLPASVAAPIID